MDLAGLVQRSLGGCYEHNELKVGKLIDWRSNCWHVMFEISTVVNIF